MVKNASACLWVGRAISKENESLKCKYSWNLLFYNYIILVLRIFDIQMEGFIILLFYPGDGQSINIKILTQLCVSLVYFS